MEISRDVFIDIFSFFSPYKASAQKSRDLVACSRNVRHFGGWQNVTSIAQCFAILGHRTSTRRRLPDYALINNQREDLVSKRRDRWERAKISTAIRYMHHFFLSAFETFVESKERWMHFLLLCLTIFKTMTRLESPIRNRRQINS